MSRPTTRIEIIPLSTGMPLYVLKSNVNFSPELYTASKSSIYSVGERLIILIVVSELVLKIHVSKIAPL